MQQNCILHDTNILRQSQKGTTPAKTSDAHRFGAKIDIFRTRLMALKMPLAVLL